MGAIPPPIPVTETRQKPITISIALLIGSYLAGAISFMGFANSSPDDPSLWNLTVLVCAYCFGFVSSLRLMRSGRLAPVATGAWSLVIQSFVIFATWMLAIGRDV